MAKAFVLNRSPILDRLGGDEEIYSMMVDMYLDSYEENCTALGAAFESGNANVLQREAHTVKGLLATFSDDEGAEWAMAIESQAKAGQLSGLADPVGALQGRMREVAEVLRATSAAAG